MLVKEATGAAFNEVIYVYLTVFLTVSSLALVQLYDFARTREVI